MPGLAESPAAVLPSGPAPAVPTLVLVGSRDLRTPVETARRAAAVIPGARILIVRGAGHSVLADGTPCVTRGVRRFLAGADPTGSRRGVDLLPEPFPTPPARLQGLVPRGLPGDAGRAVEAVRLSIEDAGRAIGLGEPTGRRVRVTGLLRGTGEFRRAGGDVVLRLARHAYVPGVEVSGALVIPGGAQPVARLTVGGVHATGTLTIRSGVVSGRLDGRPVRAALR